MTTPLRLAELEPVRSSSQSGQLHDGDCDYDAEACEPDGHMTGRPQSSVHPPSMDGTSTPAKSSVSGSDRVRPDRLVIEIGRWLVSAEGSPSDLHLMSLARIS